jgi:hypothetical protein
VVAGAFRWGRGRAVRVVLRAGTIGAGDIRALRVQAVTVRRSIRRVNGEVGS